MSGLEPESQPGTTRISGGSARATAAGIALLLAAVVWLGASGRPPTPLAVDASTPLAPAAASAPAATGALARATHGGRPRSTPEPAGSPLSPGLPLGEDGIAVIIHASGKARPYLQVMHEAGSGRLQASVRMAMPRPPIDGTLELAQLWTREEGPPFVVIQTFTLPVDALRPGAEGKTVIETMEPAKSGRPGAPRLVRLGYHLVVQVERRGEHLFLVVTLSLGGQTPGRALGDDGLIGQPGSPDGAPTR